MMVAGAFDLTAILAGITALQIKNGVRNIVFDGIDMVLGNLQDERLERCELARLNDWVRGSGASALMTVKSLAGERNQTWSYLQYMTDCVIIMEDMVTATTRSRSLRIAKYRGSGFSGSPAPVVINRSGIDVVVLRSPRASYPTVTGRISSGVPRLDALLSGGYGRGHTVLLSGAPGTAKTSLCAYFVAAACKKGKKALFVSFDESASQIVANANAIGLGLLSYVESGHLIIESLTSFGHSPEEDFVAVRGLLEMHTPDCLVIDALSALTRTDYPFTILIFQCLLDSAKSRGTTVLCTSVLVDESEYLMTLGVSIATIADTWMHVTYIANEGERNRALTIIKSRGIGHSNQVRELVLTDSGIDLSDVYVAEGQVLMGSARLQKETEVSRQQALDEIAHKRVRMERDRDVADLEVKIRTATQELEWKQQEAVFLDTSEGNRAEHERLSSAERLDLRRAGDDSAGGKPTRTRRRLRVP